MSSETSIEIRQLSKRYSIQRDHPTLLTEALGRRLRRPFQGHSESYWALRDVNLSVHPGEVLGVIGRNGAGKSTLLKVLSRITEPTKGEIELRGRLGCLLEVGTGFHPELTGRENVFLNGAILGMRKAEIRRRFDEIVDFAGIDVFLDTPVKRYSSGMYVRLAFAVAAHLDTEILVVDEVLAVGDIEFQKKCLGKMQTVAADTGRTVVFVSHNVGAVQALCSRCVLLDEGRVVDDGDTNEILRRYVALQQPEATEPGLFVLDGRENVEDPDGWLYLRRLTIKDEGGPTASLQTGRPATFEIECTGLSSTGGVFHRFHLRNELDEIVLASDTRMAGEDSGADESVRFHFDVLPLLPGRYFVDVGVGVHHPFAVLDQVAAAGTFEVVANSRYGTDYQRLQQDGSIFVPPNWSAVTKTSNPGG